MINKVTSVLDLPVVKGPSHARPMSLQLPSEEENMGWRGSDGVVKGKRTVALERSKLQNY